MLELHYSIWGVMKMNVSAARAIIIVLSVYLAWSALTYLLEGWTHTFLRPEAVVEHDIYRIIYTVVANIIVGTILAILIIRYLGASRFITLSEAGFRPFSMTLITIVVGIVLGFIIYAMGLFFEPPSLNPMVMMNGYAQSLSGAIAATLICWALAGTVFASLIKQKGRVVSVVVGILASSILFGIYHFTLPPPLNTVEVVLFTTVLVGVSTSLFFFISHNIYGTIVFSNFQWMFGVLHGQESSGNLITYTQPMYLFYALAIVSVIVLAMVDVIFIRPILKTT